jgi:hypothetical protein
VVEVVVEGLLPLRLRTRGLLEKADDGLVEAQPLLEEADRVADGEPRGVGAPQIPVDW